MSDQEPIHGTVTGGDVEHPPSAEGDNVETYEAYIARIGADSAMSRADWTRESGSAGGAGPNGLVGAAGPGDRKATSTDSAAVTNDDQTYDPDLGADVTHKVMDGTQIDPSDGVRKPVGLIERPETPVIPTAQTAEGLEVHIDRQFAKTQIGADGRRHSIDGSPDVHTSRTDG